MPFDRRLPAYLLQYSDKLDFDGLTICSNGSCIYDFASKQLVYARPIGGDIAALTAYLLEHTAHIMRMVLFTGLDSVAFEHVSEDAARIYDTVQKPVYKIVMRIDERKKCTYSEAQVKRTVWRCVQFFTQLGHRAGNPLTRRRQRARGAPPAQYGRRY